MFDVSKYAYDPSTGIITKNSRSCGVITNKGYLRIQDNGIRIMAHRLAWYLYYAKWPSNYLDHINGNRVDNRISNLRESSPRLNGLNKTIHRNGRLTGFSKQPNGKFRAEIAFEGKNYSLGNYLTEQEAHEVYEKALSKVLSGKHPLSAEPAQDDSPYTSGFYDWTKKPAQDAKVVIIQGGTCGCTSCPMYPKPAQYDGKAEVGDIVMLMYDDGSKGLREWTRWLADHDPMKGEVPAIRVVILMRAVEVKRRLEEAK